MTLTQILQKIRSAFYTKAETDATYLKDIAYNTYSRNLILTKGDGTSSEFRVVYSNQAEYAQKDWNGNNITDTYSTKTELINGLNGKSNTNHNHNSTYLGIKAKAESAKSADSVAWANVSGRPTKVSQFANDSGYITSSGSCKYANSAGSAPANGGTSTASAYLNDYGTLQYGVNRLQYFNTNTTTTSGASKVANPTNDWYYHIIQSHANSEGFYFDIASHFFSNNVYYRRIAGGVESGWIKFIDSSNIGSQSVNYAKSAGAVAWANVSGKPTIPSNTNQLTNGAGFITSSGSCNYANSSGNADTVDGSHAWQMQTLNAGGHTHGSVNWLLQCQHKADGENYFKLYVGDKSIGTKVDRASSAAYAERSMGNGAFYISGYQIYVG